jgi:succinyl-diaminopimelate desuccinylase
MGSSPFFTGGLQMEAEKKTEERKKTAALELLKHILDIPSVNGKDREQRVADYLAEYLRGKGMETTVQLIDEHHGNLIGVLKGNTEETILFNGHLDTVPYGDIQEWNTNPAVCEEQDGRFYARGASDMKSGLAVMTFVLGELAQSGYVPEKTIVFVGTCDEERGGLGAREVIKKYPDLFPELVMIGEPTSCQAGVAQKGCIWLKLTVSGKTSHGAEPWQGINALEQGFGLLGDLREELQGEEHPVLGRSTLQITMAEGGIAPNMTPDRAQFLADIRIVPPLDKKKVLNRLEYLIEKRCEEYKGELLFVPEISNYRMPVETDSENQWLHKLKGLIGDEVREVGINYFTDASIFLTAWPDCPVLLFGPGEPQMCHKPNEYVEISKYFEAIQVMEKFCRHIAK